MQVDETLPNDQPGFPTKYLEEHEANGETCANMETANS